MKAFAKKYILWFMKGIMQYIMGIYLLLLLTKKGIRLQEGETIDYKWITKTELIDFYKTECSPTSKERLKNFINSLK